MTRPTAVRSSDERGGGFIQRRPRTYELVFRESAMEFQPIVPGKISAALQQAFDLLPHSQGGRRTRPIREWPTSWPRPRGSTPIITSTFLTAAEMPGPEIDPLA